MNRLKDNFLARSAWFPVALIVGLCLGANACISAAELVLSLQTRQPENGEIVVTTERIDPQRIGVVAVDVWNYHWCKTATMRVDALVPRIDQALQAARELGMTVMLCPSDVVENYAGFPQRERVLALPTTVVPKVMAIDCPPVPDAGGCACGRERCGGNYGWDGMHPGLKLGPEDFMPDTQAEVFAICQQRHLTHLIYVGFHTQVCLLGKPMGLRAMKMAGLNCLLARDMTDAHPGYDPARQFTPDLNTEQVVEHFEKHLAPTINLAEELSRVGHWDHHTLVDPVRITPWGTPHRPHLFEESVTVTLTAPFQRDAQIHYTLDGSTPTIRSPKYVEPMVMRDSHTIRATAFRDGTAVCRESVGEFVHLPPLPPLPDRYLGELQPLHTVGFGHTYGGDVRYSGSARPPQVDRSNLGEALKVNRQVYAHGLGVHAPNAISYRIRPEYVRFVGLAGVDEQILAKGNGSNLAKYPSVSFRIFIDGELVASSPVMRMQSLAWRFDVPIAAGSQVMRLVAMDAGDGSREDLADWVDAGFIVKP